MYMTDLHDSCLKSEICSLNVKHLQEELHFTDRKNGNAGIGINE